MAEANAPRFGHGPGGLLGLVDDGQATANFLPDGLDTTKTPYSRVGRWFENSNYSVGQSRIQLFSVVAEVPEHPTPWRQDCERAAGWAVEQCKLGNHPCCLKERIDFPANQHRHLVVTGFFNQTDGQVAWAGIFVRNSGGGAGCFLNNVPGQFIYTTGWYYPWWQIGPDRAQVTLQYADKDGGGLAWAWHFK